MKEIAIMLALIYIGVCTWQIGKEDKKLTIPDEIDWDFVDRER